MNLLLSGVPVGSHCRALGLAVTSLWSLHNTLMGLLHLFRTRAISLDRIWMVRYFLLLWIISSGISLAISPFLLRAEIVGTNSCVQTEFNLTFARTSVALNTFKGTCIVIATSDTLALYPTDARRPVGKPSFLERFKSGLIAKDIPSFSKSLLRHGQRYYL